MTNAQILRNATQGTEPSQGGFHQKGQDPLKFHRDQDKNKAKEEFLYKTKSKLLNQSTQELSSHRIREQFHLTPMENNKLKNPS